MSEPEFLAWPKTPRLYKRIIITEKIDGTNAAVIVTEAGEVFAQSRKRLITPEDDNFGFALWALENRDYLAETLGPGHHFGEWYGRGIQRGYGLSERYFALFNTTRWWEGVEMKNRLTVVPVLYDGVYDEDAVPFELERLRTQGSWLGDSPAEGICIYFREANQVFKVLCENDEIPKSLIGAK